MFSQCYRLAIFCMLFLLISCTDATEYQIEFRGAWSLVNRKLSDGKILAAPEVSGLLEWFPVSETRAHVSLSYANVKNNIQIHESLYELSENTFSRQDQLRRAEGATEFLTAKSQGQISTSGEQVILVHADGSRFVFEGASLTITHANGFVDTWKLARDQKGTLAK
ncbi:MAG: hypothetical protein O7G87_00030 [bacterium]|nr:hypothetical protein [bacterium]